MKEEKNKFEERKELERKRKEELKKMQNAKLRPSQKKTLQAVLGVIIAVIVIAAVVLGSTGAVPRMLTAEKIDGEKVSTAEMEYYYASSAITMYNTYSQYFNGSYAPFDMTKKLSKQDYSEDQTWGEFFKEEAKAAVLNVKTLVKAAKEENFTLSQEGSDAVEATMTALSSYAKNAGLGLGAYLQKYYGKGVNEKLVRRVLTEQQLASEYDRDLYDRLSYTEEDLENYYAGEGRDELEEVDLRYFAVLETEQNDTTAAITLEEAKAAAEAMIDGVSAPEDFGQKVVDYLTQKMNNDAKIAGKEPDPSVIFDNSVHNNQTRSSLGIDQGLTDWAFDESRSAGDTAVLENASGNGYYAVYMVNPAHRNDYNAVTYRALTVNPEQEGEEALKKCEEKANSMYEEWKSGEATEESFAKMLDDAGLENGGLVEKSAKNSTDVSNWLFDEARQSGDTTVMEEAGSYYVLYFVGQDEPYWMIQAENALRGAEYAEKMEALTAGMTVTENKFGLWAMDEPFV